MSHLKKSSQSDPRCNHQKSDSEEIELSNFTHTYTSAEPTTSITTGELCPLDFPFQHTKPLHDKRKHIPENLFLDNIIVGYAFGPKKMETMGLIMAEASKALSTFEAPTTTANELANMMNVQVQHYSMDLGDESSMTTTAATTSTVPATSGTEENIRSHYFSDNEEDERSLSSTRSCSVVSQRSQRGGGGGIQLTFLPDSNGFIHLLRKSSNGCEGGGDQSITGTSVTTIATAATPFRKQYLPPRKLDSSTTVTPQAPFTPLRCNNDRDGLKRHPIRVSFVPIDLDMPLEEQHGGKFDVILHKMTEDILCISKMFRSRQPSVENASFDEREEYCQDVELDLIGLEDMHLPLKHTLAEPPDSIVGSSKPTTMTRHQARAASRIRRLREYKEKVHTSCVLVDSPNNILAVMSRADMAEVLSSCLAGVTTKGGITVRTPRFRVVEEGDDCNTLSGGVHEICDNESIRRQRLADEIESAGFEYPLIAKPLTAAGTKSSHHMGIVMARDGLSKLKTPCLLQEYANHGGKLFKVYVLGDSVWVFARESLPNLPIGEREVRPVDSGSFESTSKDGVEETEKMHLPFHKRRPAESYVEFERPAGSRCYVEFNSQRPYPKLSDFGISESIQDHSMDAEVLGTDTALKHASQNMCNSYSWGSPTIKKQRLNKDTSVSQSNEFIVSDLAHFVSIDEIEPVTNALRAAFGLELFGFDILVKHEESNIQNDDKEILVVDVNYFPGYKEVSNFPSLLAQYLTKKAVESRLQNFYCN
ncbi:hypothetical protein ACHAXS_001659 [Conticribra weissflogii]